MTHKINYRKKKPKRKNKTKLLIAITILVIAIFFLDLAMRTIVNKAAIQQAKMSSTNIVNKIISKELSKENIDYFNLLKIEKNKDGKISSLDTNMRNTNLLKSNITSKIQDELSESSSKNMYVSLGSLTSGHLLDGRGPSIPIKIIIYGNVIAKFRSEFSEAGFNQTRHQVYIDIQTEILAMIPGYPTVTGIETSVLVAETIIVGDVPEVLASLDGNTTLGGVIKSLNPNAKETNTP